MPKSTDFLDDLVAWMLQNEQLKAMKAYLDRGRRYRARDAQMLKTRWLTLFEQTAALDFTDETERHDIEAELRLRKMEPPVTMEMVRAFKRRVDDAAARRSPSQQENARRYLDRMLEEYAADLGARRS